MLKDYTSSSCKHYYNLILNQNYALITLLMNDVEDTQTIAILPLNVKLK